MRQKTPLSAIIAIFAGGSLITMGLRLIGGVLTARFAPPAVLGLFMGISLILEYAPIAQLGVLNGLNRELPYYIGKGEKARAHELASFAQYWALLLGSGGASILFFVAIWHSWIGRWDLAAGWLTNAFSIFLLFYSQMYLQVTFRTSGDFARLSVINVVQSAAALLLISLVWFFGFFGLCLRSVGVGIIGAVLLWSYCPLKVIPKWNKQDLLHLLKIGCPIFFVGQAYSLWVVLDSTLVLRFLGFQFLGFYQLATMAGQMMETLPSAVSQILYPKMAEEYGRTKSLRNVLEITRKPILATIGIVFPLVLIAWFALPPTVEWLLPKYLGGVSSARWALLSAGLMAFAPINITFNVIGRQGLYLSCIVAGVTAYLGALLWLSSSGIALENFPQAMIFGRVVFFVSSYLSISRLHWQS